REGATQRARSFDVHQRLRIATRSTFKNEKTRFALGSSTAATGTNNQQVIDGIDRDGVELLTGVRSFDRALWRDVAVVQAVIYKDHVAFGNVDLVIFRVASNALRRH